VGLARRLCRDVFRASSFSDAANLCGVPGWCEVYDAEAGLSGDKPGCVAVGRELNSGGWGRANSGLRQLSVRFMVYVSAADQPNAIFMAAEISEQFASGKSDGIHPNAVEQYGWVMHKKGAASFSARQQLRFDPCELFFVEASCNRPRHMCVEAKA